MQPPPGLIINISSTINPTCVPGCDGTATLTAAGGTAPYVYSISPSGTISGNVANNLCAGTIYTIVATDANNATSATTLALVAPMPPSISITSTTAPSCSPGCDGTANFTTTAGGTYTISGAGFPTINPAGIASNLCVNNTYLITVADANGCTATSNVLFTISSFTPTYSTGPGSLTASAPLQTPPITYSLNGAPFSSNNTFTGLCTGGYTLQVQDGNGCLGTIYTTVNSDTAFPGATMNTFITHESCSNANDGSIDYLFTPSSTHYFCPFGVNCTNTISYFNGLTAGIYGLNIFDSTTNYCVTVLDTILTLGTNCGTISGYVYLDSASDCNYNAGDYYIMNRQINLSTGAIAFTDPSGFYQFNTVPLGTHTLTEVLSAPNFQNSCTQPSTVTINSLAPTSVNNNFKDSSGVGIDEYLYLIGTRYVPGIAPTWVGAWIKLETVNPSPYTVNNKVTLVLNDSLNFAYSVPAPSNITPTPNGDSLTWFVTVPPNSSWWNNMGNEILVYINTPTNLTLGSLLTSCATLTPTNVTDVNMANNSVCITKEVSTSFDPNDKTVQPEGIGTIGGITLQDKTLDYRVRFQNTGTSPAHNIIIMDTLSTKLDINTFKVLSFSHPYKIEIIDGHILKFKFENIMLPDSGSNLQASNGHISYQIMQKSTNVIGDVVKNKAYIYFDFNAPIITNETINTIISPTAIYEMSNNLNTMEIYPNPAQNSFAITSNSIIEECSILDIHSRKVYTQNDIHTNSINVNTALLSNGIYFVKLKNGAVRKLVIEK
jgi:hypothetical protein